MDVQNRVLLAVNTSSPTHGIADKYQQDAEETTNVLSLEHNLRDAIEEKQFELYYQPIIELKTESIAGCEALIRWNHPALGLVPPNEFIPKAEESGLINPMGKWIIEEACQAHNRFQTLANKNPNCTKNIYMSINLSGKQFEDMDLINDIANIFTNDNIKTSYIKMEITETLLMANPELAAASLSSLKRLGVTLAIDDFGTGYSSFSYLHRFPLDTLKIDRAFISSMLSNNKSLEIVRSLINLAHNLGMNVIAEGFEQEEEKSQLQTMDCDYGQGYYFSKPVPEREFAELLKNGVK